MKSAAVGLLCAALAQVSTLSCAAPEKAVAKAATVVNHAAKVGNVLAMGVARECDAQERAAVELEPLELAEERLTQVRSTCDVALHSLGTLAMSIDAADAAFACVERGECDVDVLVSTSMGAMQEARETKAAVEEAMRSLRGAK